MTEEMPRNLNRAVTSQQVAMPQPSLFISFGDVAYSIYDRIQLIQASNEHLKVMEDIKNSTDKPIFDNVELKNCYQAASALIELHMKHVVQEHDGVGRDLVNAAFQNLLMVEEFCSGDGKNIIYDQNLKMFIYPPRADYLLLNEVKPLMEHQKEKLKVELEAARVRLLSSPIVTRTYLSLAL